MRGKLCFIVFSVILAVTIGHTSDISAYTYSGTIQEAVRESNNNRIAGSGSVSFELHQSVTKEAAEEAAQAVSAQIVTVTSEKEAADEADSYSEDVNYQETETTTETTETAYEAEESSETEESKTGEAAESTESGSQAETETSEPTDGENEASDSSEKEESEESLKAETEVTGETDPWDFYKSINEAPYDDAAILCQIVMCEAGSEDIIGQIMVANVILNRVNAGTFGSSVYDVVFAPGQFEPVGSGFYWMVTPTESVKEAVYRALNGEDYSEGALYFCSRYYSGWHDSNLTYVTEHGGHIFYR